MSPTIVFVIERVNAHGYKVRLDTDTDMFTSEEEKWSVFGLATDAVDAWVKANRSDAYIVPVVRA